MGQCHWGINNWALFPVKMLRINTNICGCQIAWTATARWQYHKKPKGCCIIGYLSETKISWKMYFAVVKSFWNFSQSTAVSLPCSVKIFKMIWQLKWMLWINMILQDFSLWWFWRDILYCNILFVYVGSQVICQGNMLHEWHDNYGVFDVWCWHNRIDGHATQVVCTIILSSSVTIAATKNLTSSLSHCYDLEFKPFQCKQV